MAQAQTINQQGAAEHKRIALDEYIAAYEHHPIEVHRGQIVPMTPPNLEHIHIAHDLYNSLLDYLKTHPLGRAWLETPYLLEGGERSDWVEDSCVPDVSFATTQHMAKHKEEYGNKRGPWRFAPDLAAEIVSPNDKYTEVNQKAAGYLYYGVRLVWIIDPKMQNVRVVTPDNPGGLLLEKTATLTGDPVLPGWSMPIVELFGDEAKT